MLAIFEHLFITQAIPYWLSLADSDSAEPLKAESKVSFKCIQKFALQVIRKAMAAGFESEPCALSCRFPHFDNSCVDTLVNLQHCFAAVEKAAAIEILLDFEGIFRNPTNNLLQAGIERRWLEA